MQNQPIFSGESPLTLKQIALDINHWCDNPSQGDLPQKIQLILASVREQSSAITIDPTVVPELSNLLQGSIRSYQALAECLEEILVGIKCQNVVDVEAELLYLKAGMCSLRQYTEAIELWLMAPTLRCPRCGSATPAHDDICDKCDLEMLLPDLSPSSKSNRSFLSLGPEYMAVYKTYISVLAGETPLDQLVTPLQELRNFFAPYLRMANLTNEEALRQRLKRVEKLCLDSLSGIEQMDACFQTREASDLNQGWLTIYNSSAELKEALPSLLGELGVQSESSNSVDSVQLSQ